MSARPPGRGRAISVEREHSGPAEGRYPRQTCEMSSGADAELIHLIDRYLSGEHSGRLVSEIEGIVIESFQNAEWYDDVGEALALYAPGQGQPYLDDNDLKPILRRLRTGLGGHS